jgi:hypothetical protein
VQHCYCTSKVTALDFAYITPSLAAIESPICTEIFAVTGFANKLAGTIAVS